MGKSLVTGIEIGHHSIKAVVLKPNKGTLALVDYQELPIEAGIFSDNHMSKYQKIVKKLKELRKSLPRFSRKVAFAIPDNAVISKVLQIDSDYDSNETEFAIAQAFSYQSPFSTEELNLDYVLLSQDVHQSKASYQVYATKKEVVTDNVEVFKRAGFLPVCVDMRAHGLVHVWQLAARTQIKSDWLLVEISSLHLSLCIDFPDKAPYCKEIHLGENPVETGSDCSNGSIGQLVDKIQRNLQHIASVHDVVIAGVWLSGEEAEMPRLSEEIHRRLNIECEVLNPLCLLESTCRRSPDDLPEQGLRFVLAIGIALRGVSWLERRHVA